MRFSRSTYIFTMTAYVSQLVLAVKTQIRCLRQNRRKPLLMSQELHAPLHAPRTAMDLVSSGDHQQIHHPHPPANFTLELGRRSIDSRLLIPWVAFLRQSATLGLG
jgi:hypothetical protein